ncbi:MAG: CPBP family intramembrane glutamic endopeptidase [Terracidiphilus sp.]
MEPELRPAVEEESQPAPTPGPAPHPSPQHDRDFDWVFIGPHGLRAGWSILLFAALYYLFREVIGTLFFAAGLVHDTPTGSAGAVLVAELVPFFALIAAALIMTLIEDTRIVGCIPTYNLAGTHRARHFISGLVAGFAALSLLVAALAWGGWLRFGAASQSVAQAAAIGALWAIAFLLVGSVEEGLFRCYALATLTRGINFWWALAAEIAICFYLTLNGGGNGAWGVYFAAAIGFFPCLMLHRKLKAQSAAFWQAAWVTSTFFGFYHTSNNGENWIGVFAASSIGFVFCLSVRLTGSAWWAIGCHAAWDWTETFFYGAADSGLQGQGHFLSASPAGNPLWSGGADGPEGSLLVLGVILLLLLLLLALYARNRATPAAQPAD